MRHRTDLRRLALAVVEGAAERVVAPVEIRDARVPKLLRIRLVGDIAQHPDHLAVADLVEQLAAELEIVALLIDREGAVATI
jgi:hypothetical protein